MKTLFFVTLFAIPMLGYALSSTETTEIKVYGSCGMCKARIENNAMVEGVETAKWSQKTQTLTLTYNADNTSLDKVHDKIAGSGHDTEKVKADDDVYKSLPACCHYERADYDKNRNEIDESRDSHDSHSHEAHGCCSN